LTFDFPICWHGIMKVNHLLIGGADDDDEVDSEEVDEVDSEEVDEVDSEEEDDWEEVYREYPDFREVGGAIDGIYYQTFGGGPEGGYVVESTVDGDRLFSVKRSWFKPWTITRMRHKALKSQRRHNIAEVRVVVKKTPDSRFEKKTVEADEGEAED